MSTMPSRLFLLAWLAVSLYSQTTAGRFSGSVQDPSGAAVPGVRITASNAETGQQVVETSNAEGRFVIYPMAPGLYTITAQKDGFSTFTMSGVQVDVSESVVRNISLRVGDLSQSVSVTAESAAILTDSPAIAGTIVRQQIEELPLNGRDFNQLVLLSAGSVDNNTGGNNDFGSVALNGNRTYGNAYLVDGTPNTNSYQGTSAVPLSIDLIREFKVYSGVAPAEFGQGGSQVTVVTQSGSNRYHGNLFEYYRGTQLEARNPFNTSGQASFLRNQFGGTFGGPLRLPHYNGQNKTFFFVNYEGNRQYQQATRFSSVPLSAMWSGDFSAALALGIQLHDPLAARALFPNDQIPVSRIDKTALAIRPYFGSPTQPGTGNNQVTNVDQDTIADQYTIRGDQMLAHNNTVSVRYTGSHTGGFIPNLLGSPGVGRSEPLDNENATASWTSILSPRTVSELKLGAMKFGDVTSYTAGSLPTAVSLGIQGFTANNPAVPLLPYMNFSGVGAPTNIKFGDTASFGEAALSMIQNVYTVNETVSHIAGNHSLKFGYELHREDYNALQQSDAGGEILFSGSATSANSSGYAFGDLLLGIPSSTSQIPVKPKILLRQTEMAGFAQDDWRIAPGLTLSMGLRYELFLNPYEDRNRLAMFDIKTGSIVVASNDGTLPVSQYLPADVANLTDASGNWKFPLLSDKQAGFDPRRLLATQLNNWGPRFGFAWHAGSKTVVRSGYGIFYSRYPIQYLLQTVAVNPPFAGTFTYSQSIKNGAPALTLSAPYLASGSGTVAPAGIQQNFELPSNQQWNFTIERDLGWDSDLTLSYIGNKGTHLFRSINANSAYINPVTNVLVRNYSSAYGTSTINFRESNGDSIYDAMNLELRHRFYKHLLFQANWAWAKGIDDVGQNVQSALLDVQNLGRDRANSDYVRRHTVNINGVYDLPVGRNQPLLAHMPRALDSAVGGWKLGAIWHYGTGRYLTPACASAGGLSNTRPDVVYGVQANLPADQRTPAKWFNPAGFACVPAADPITGLPRFGNAGRNTIIGPDTNYMDANLAKVFPLGSERRTLTLRVEAFNLLNHPNYANPNLTISTAATAATITSILRDMREVQFVARFAF
jgi:hypothetical protein